MSATCFESPGTRKTASRRFVHAGAKDLRSLAMSVRPVRDLTRTTMAVTTAAVVAPAAAIAAAE